jgi:hypothetical protein
VHTPLNKDYSLLSAVFGNSLSHQETQSPIHLLHQRPHLSILPRPTAAMVSQKKPTGATRNARGGAIAKRKVRTDRDGDLAMDPIARARPGGGVNKGGKGGAPKMRGAKPAARGSGFEKQLASHVGGASTSTRTRPSRGLEELRVTGHKNSKAASNSDGGLNSLIVWVEKRASLKAKRPVKVKKVHALKPAHPTCSLSPGSVRFRLQPISERRPEPSTLLLYP